MLNRSLVLVPLAGLVPGFVCYNCSRIAGWTTNAEGAFTPGSR
jgi:hypothetical protein